MADEERKEDLLGDPDENEEPEDVDSPTTEPEEEEEEPDRPLEFPQGFDTWYKQQGPARPRVDVIHKPKKIDIKGKMEVCSPPRITPTHTRCQYFV